MSGNSTRMSVGIAQGSVIALVAALILLAFVFGATLGSLIGRRFRARRQTMVLAFATALLIGAAGSFSHGTLSAGLMFAASAMGAENATFEENGEIRIGLTYMTGTLAKAGQRLADALSGGDVLGWAPYLGQWFALVIGSVAGAASYGSFGRYSFWFAALAAGALCRVALSLERRGKGRRI